MSRNYLCTIISQNLLISEHFIPFFIDEIFQHIILHVKQFHTCAPYIRFNFYSLDGAPARKNIYFFFIFLLLRNFAVHTKWNFVSNEKCLVSVKCFYSWFGSNCQLCSLILLMFNVNVDQLTSKKTFRRDAEDFFFEKKVGGTGVQWFR